MDKELQEFYLERLAEEGPGAVVVNSPGVLQYKNLRKLKKLSRIPLNAACSYRDFEYKSQNLYDLVQELPTNCFALASREPSWIGVFTKGYWICIMPTNPDFVKSIVDSSSQYHSDRQKTNLKNEMDIIKSQLKYSAGVGEFGQPGVVLKLPNGKFEYKTTTQLQNLLTIKIDTPGMQSYTLAEVIQNCPKDRFVLVDKSAPFWLGKSTLAISVVAKGVIFE